MSIGRGIDKEDMVCMCTHIYDGILFSHKKNGNNAILAVTWMDLEMIILGEVR